MRFAVIVWSMVSTRPPAPSPDPLRRTVAALAGAGATLPDIDRDVVAPAALDEEGRSALWLYAWHALEADEVARPRIAA